MIAVLCVTPAALSVARKVVAALPGAQLHGLAERIDGADVVFSDTKAHVADLFKSGTGIVGVCAAGILIRAIGPERLAELIAAEGEGGALATLGKQAAWRDRPAGDLLHRFLRSKASRSLRYARLIVEALDEGRIPAPLSAVLASV